MATYSLAALQRKKFFRSPQWEVKLVLWILLGFFVLYMLISFLLLGLGLHFILKDIVKTPQTLAELETYFKA